MKPLPRLNPDQEKAVRHGSGPLLVVAGPGTGKTHTIAMRVVHLVESGVPAGGIVAITFTNRAAAEMSRRVQALLGEDADGLFIGTFHRLGLEIIRRQRGEARLIGRDEQIDLLRRVAPEKNPDRLCGEVSAVKNLLLEPDGWLRELCRSYQEALEGEGLIDIDDLILLPLRLLSDPETRDDYHARFHHILVDEYQDINPAQYGLIKRIVNEGRNIFAVGDADQAIYSFRGANVRNFLAFTEDFPDAETVVLRESYRSTSTIIEAASAVIGGNSERMEKELRPRRGRGPAVTIVSLPDGASEARYVAGEIERRVGGIGHHSLVRGDQRPEGRPFSDFAVLTRINALIPEVERALKAAGIPCRVFTGEPLRDAGAVRTVMTFARAVLDPREAASLTGAINTEQKQPRGTPLHRGLRAEVEGGEGLEDPASLLDSLRRSKDTLSVDEILRRIIADTGLDLTPGREKEALEGLLEIAYGFRKRPLAEALRGIEEELLLGSRADLYSPEAEAVSLLTIHSAKGLEFPVVFITGAEEGIIPLGMGEGVDVEEERRLLYVAMTRAGDELFITHARRRRLFGKVLSRRPSPFLTIRNDLKREVFIPDAPPERRQRQVGLF